MRWQHVKYEDVPWLSPEEITEMSKSIVDLAAVPVGCDSIRSSTNVAANLINPKTTSKTKSNSNPKSSSSTNSKSATGSISTRTHSQSQHVVGMNPKTIVVDDNVVAGHSFRDDDDDDNDNNSVRVPKSAIFSFTNVSDGDVEEEVGMRGVGYEHVLFRDGGATPDIDFNMASEHNHRVIRVSNDDGDEHTCVMLIEIFDRNFDRDFD